MVTQCNCCGNEEYVDPMGENVDVEKARCSACGRIGTMKCTHSNPDATGEACADCGADFS